jgi:hypothetical protein
MPWPENRILKGQSDGSPQAETSLIVQIGPDCQWAFNAEKIRLGAVYDLKVGAGFDCPSVRICLECKEARLVVGVRRICYECHIMSDERTIKSIARKVATANLGKSNVAGVLSKDIVDSEGRDAFLITIVLTPGSSDSIKGPELLNTMVQIHDRLQQQGENRFPFVKYADKNELEERGAAQS